MHTSYEESTSFIIDRRLYCHKIILFGLKKNVEATCQRLINKIFTDLIDKTIKVYVDDMLLNSRKTTNHFDHLGVAFKIMRKYVMRFNPLKCASGTAFGMFLGYMVN